MSGRSGFISFFVNIHLRVFFLKSPGGYTTPGDQHGVFQNFRFYFFKFYRGPARAAPGIGHGVNGALAYRGEDILEFLVKFEGASFLKFIDGDKYFFIDPVGNQVKMRMLVGFGERESDGFY